MNPQFVSKVRSAACCALSAVLGLAIFWSVRLAWADYDAAQPDLSSVTDACRLAPESAQYWLRAAAVREIDRPDDSEVDADIRHALALNSRYTEAWMARAFRDEARGHVTQAEQDYFAATRVNRMYKPAWALANFYYRQGQPRQFWLWARRCLEVVEPRRLEPASYNPAPVFDLAWQVTSNAAEIRANLIPPRHFILVDYLDYLGDRNLLEAGSDVAVDLAAYADLEDNYVLLNFCDRLINHAMGRRAMDIWNAMVARGTLRAEHVDPDQGRSLTNGDLKRPFERAGFDWRLPPAEGVAQEHFVSAGECRLEFSGDQPEGVMPLYQNLPVVPGAYRLAFQYRTGAEHVEGLSWQIWDYARHQFVPVRCRFSPHAEWAGGEAAFTIPQGASIVRLCLIYHRASGSTRIHGTVSFRDFALRLENRVRA